MSTSIAIIRSKQGIAIAADSAASDENGNLISTSECKIRRIGRFVYVPSKYTESSADDYDVHRIIEIAGNSESLEALARRLRELIPQPLVRSLTAARRRNPTRFKENFKSRQVVGITLAGIESGRPSLIDLRFHITDMQAADITLNVEEHWCPGKDCPNEVATIFVGPKDLQDRFAKRFPNYWRGNVDNLAQHAEAFVQMAIDARLPDVAPPIAVLVIGSNGFEWRRPCNAEVQSAKPGYPRCAPDLTN